MCVFLLLQRLVCSSVEGELIGVQNDGDDSKVPCVCWNFWGPDCCAGPVANMQGWNTHSRTDWSRGGDAKDLHHEHINMDRWARMERKRKPLLTVSKQRRGGWQQKKSEGRLRQIVGRRQADSLSGRQGGDFPVLGLAFFCELFSFFCYLQFLVQEKAFLV